MRRLHAVAHDGALGVEKPVEKDGHDHSKRGTMEIRRAQALARSVANPTPHPPRRRRWNELRELVEMASTVTI